MSAPIRIPRVGQSMTEATLVSWERITGDLVAPGDVVATIETDKTEVEVEAPIAGVLGQLRALVGEVCPVGALLAYVLAEGELEPEESSPANVAAVRAARQTTAPARGGPLVSPRARRMAEERSIDMATLVGTGPDGLVTERDVDAATVMHRGERRRSLSARERTAARNLTASWTQAPHFTQLVDAEMTEVLRRCARHDNVTVNDVVLRAVALALVAVPACNVRFERGEVIELASVDLGIAVDAPTGLVVPVLRDVDGRDLAGLSMRARDLVGRARTNTLSAHDVGLASATVSNLGAQGIRAGTAVLPVDHAVLVFVGAIEERAVVRDGVVVARPMCTLSLTYDHRVIDGATGARFARAIVAELERGEPV